MSAPIAGLFLPVTTPFSDDGAPAPDRLAEQVALYMELPLAGVLVFGTTGEGPMIADDEEAELLAAARDAVPRDRRLLVQVGRESTAAARQAAARAFAAGADAILALPPRYYPVGLAGLADYYRGVSAAADVPLLAYHIPQRSHVDLPMELLAGLAAEGVIVGIKDSAGDVPLQRALRESAGRDFAVLDGKAGVLAESLEGGADGAILAVADAAPEAALAVFAAHEAGDREAAREAQERLRPLAEAVGPVYGVPGVKAAIDLRGWPGGGAPRPPLAPLDAEARVDIAAALRVAGVASILTA